VRQNLTQDWWNSNAYSESCARVNEVFKAGAELQMDCEAQSLEVLFYRWSERLTILFALHFTTLTQFKTLTIRKTAC